MSISWEKVACALLGTALLLAGFGLHQIWTVKSEEIPGITERVTKNETRMAIWHTSASTYRDTPSGVMLAGYRLSRDEQLDFAQRAMIKAYREIKSRDYDVALNTLLVGLEDSGIHCKEHRESLRCE